MTDVPSASAAPAAAEPRSILVIDDHDLQLNLMSLLLRQAFPGARVELSRNPIDALALCETERFDCVIADYRMPDMDGLTFSSRLRERAPYLPIVLCTGGGDEMLVAEAMTHGVTQYLPKTRVSPDSLRRTISHAMQIMSQGRMIAEQREELENFAYALAHDFKQPIRQIRTFTALIGESVTEARAPELEHLRFLSDAARRLGRLVDVMSQYALLGRSPELGPVDLEQVLAGVGEAIGSYIEERGAEVTVQPAPVVLGNDALMGQVLQNLIVNGLKYNESPTPSVAIAFTPVEQDWVISVRDNGIGIPAAYLEQIFKPLARLHTNAEYEGTGLGLAMARKAIVAQGGTIWCVSEPGGGSEFFVRAPAYVADAAAEPLTA